MAIVALAAALLPWNLSDGAIREQILAQAQESIGLSPQMPARVTFSMLPRPRVKVEDFSILDQRSGFSVSAKVAKGDLRLLALASGKIELSSLTLFQPSIVVDIDRSPMQPQGAIARASGVSPTSPEAASMDSTRLAIVRVVGGELSIRSRRRRFETRFDNLDAKLDWRLLGGPASLTATGDWRGRSAALTAWIGRPVELLRGGASPIKISENSELLTSRFDGSLQAGSAWRLVGRMDGSSPALQALGRWVGDPAAGALPRAFGSATLGGRISAGEDGLSFTEAAVSVGGSDFEGDAALRLTGPRPVLSATLASESLSLTPYLADFPALFDQDGGWSDRTIPTDFGNLDLDLRMSAARAKINRVELSDLGFTVLLNGGRLDLSLAEAKAYGGALKGQATLIRSTDGETLSGSANFSNLELGGMLWDADDCDRLNGAATGQFSLDSRGASVAELLRGLRGSAQFNVQHGEVVGIDLEQALRRVEKRPLSVALEVRAGRTTFDTFAGGLSFGDDKAKLQNVRLAGPGAKVDLSGETLLGERALAIKAVAQQAGSDGAPTAGGARLTMNVEGYWDEPHLVLDVDSLVRRSEAAAPLFAPAGPAAHEQ